MEVIHHEPTDETPEVHFNKDAGVFKINGKSLPEDAAEFYEPLLDWVDEYAQSPLKKTQFHIHLFYFNTASSKLLLDLFVRFEEIHLKGKELGNTVHITWFFDEDDEDMEDAGIDFRDVIEIPFTLESIAT